VIGDPRLRTKSYGARFLGSLPPFARTSELQQAVEFLHARQFIA
jgi:Rad3-related DNA helicase